LGPVLVVVAIAVLGSAVWFGRYALLQGAAGLWIVSDLVTPSDVAVVLGGELQTRPFAAADLYRRGLVKQVLVSDEVAEPSDQLGVTERDTEENEEVLLKLGVPKGAITTFGHDNASTYDEAVALRAWSKLHGAKRFVIPTDIFATRRARWIFNRVLAGVGASAEVVAVEPHHYHRVGWWRTSEGFVAFQEEVTKYLYYRARY
jgi:uncharacterized SAM-binding protein YcdF (DUF218 family)